MPASRVMPTAEATDLIQLVRDLAEKELAPRAAADEASETFPRDVFRMLGQVGVLGLPYPEEHGGGGQPYEVYLQVLEELARVWASIGVGVSVHALSCFGLVTRGTDEQRERLLPELLGGDLLGAYCLSEPQAGSDPAAMTTTARRDGDDYVIDGTKAWVTHGGHADFYKVMARTAPRDAGRQRDLLLPGAGRQRRPERRPAGAEDGAHRQRHRHDALRQGPGPRRPPPRRGGRRARHRAGRARRGAARHRRGRDRAGAGRARRRRRLRPGARDVRPPDHRPPGARLRARRHGRGGRVGARDVPRGGAAQGPGAAVRHARRRSPSWSRPTTP